MNWKPPTMKLLNIKQTERPSRESLDNALDYLIERLVPDEALTGPYDAAMSVVVDELLALRYGAEQLVYDWRCAANALGASDGGDQYHDAASRLEKLFRGEP